jgi:hypothetical protein
MSKNNFYFMKFGSTAVKISIVIFCVVTSCGLVGGDYRRFEGTLVTTTYKTSITTLNTTIDILTLLVTHL